MKNSIYLKKFLSENDFKYYSDLVSNDKVMVMNYGRVFTSEEANLFYEGMLKINKKYESFGYFKVFEKTTDTYLGLGGMRIYNDFTEAEIEYMILSEYWGKGYGTEIVRELLKKTKEAKSIQVVTANIDPNNIGSKKILLNNGFASCKLFENTDDGSPVEMFSKKIIHSI